MSDLISRQAAIEHLKKRLYETALNNVTEHPYYEEMADNRVSVWLKEVPSVQPQRMRGRWIEDGYNDEKAVCDQCGEPCATYIMGEPRDKYCKWCGADMRGTE